MCIQGLLLVRWLPDCWLVVCEQCKVVGTVVGVGYQTWGYCISQMFEAWVEYATWADVFYEYWHGINLNTTEQH